MKIADVTSRLREQLDERLSADGFKFRKTNAEYVRKQGDLRYIFRLGIHAMTDWFLVTPVAFVGSTVINKAFNEILGRNISTSGSTCGFGIGNECNHQRGRYQIETEDDILASGAAIWRDYAEVAAPFYESVNSMEGIDGYMNSIHENRHTAGSVGNACMGLIVAKMVGNPRFNELADTYYDFWAKTQSLAIAADILTVRKALEGTNEITRWERQRN